MKPVLIVENSTSSLIREEHSSVSGQMDYVMGGTFTEFGVKNRNERIYNAPKFLPALQELNERINNLGVVYGEFDHPDVFDTSLSRASHIITKAEYVSEKNLVAGEIKLLSTYWGKEAKSLVNDGMPVFVSSRAAGITENDGSVSLKKLFTYDIVADPGFASAKMSVKSLNESLGYKDDQSNFRIYEMSDESKINELFNMNNNEFVTKKQLTDYSNYLVNELATTKKQVSGAITKGNVNPKKLEQLLEYYEELNSSSSKVVEYLEYLAKKVQVVVNENKSLKETTTKLSKHNDYLAENLEKSINYTEYLAENLDKNIEYSEYIAENLDKNISYSEYIAENLDKSIEYQGVVVERLNSGKLNESTSNTSIPTLKDAGFENINEELYYDDLEEVGDEDFTSTDEYEGGEFGTEDEFGEEEVYAGEEEEYNGFGELSPQEFYNKEEDEYCEITGDNDTELSESINKLIEEAKNEKFLRQVI